MSFIENQLKREYKAGDVIFKDGDPGMTMFILLNGKVEITKILGDHKTVLATLTDGSIFGEMAVIDRQARSATATAVSICTALEISRDMLDNRLEAVPGWLKSFFAILVDRLRASTRKQSILLTQGPGRQIVTIVSMMAQNTEPDSSGKIVLHWGKTIQTIGFILGFDEEEIGKIMISLTTAKAFRSDRREKMGRVLIVDDLERLKHLGQFCKERYLVEGGALKKISDEYRIKSREEVELLSTIASILKEQGAMEDFPVSLLESMLEQKFKKKPSVYHNLIEDLKRHEVLELFAGGTDDAAYRIMSRDKLEDLLARIRLIKELHATEQKLLA